MVTGNAPLSLRAYAKLRGCSAKAVSIAISSGRLKNSVVFVGGAPKIADRAAADAEWVANTDLSKAPDTVKARADVKRRRSASISDLSKASTREKNARANLAELEYQEKAGRLVSAARVEAAIADMVTAAREAALSIPAKVKGRIPHLTAAEVAIIDDEVRRVLEGLADRRKHGHGAAA